MSTKQLHNRKLGIKRGLADSCRAHAHAEVQNANIKPTTPL